MVTGSTAAGTGDVMKSNVAVKKVVVTEVPDCGVNRQALNIPGFYQALNIPGLYAFVVRGCIR